MTYVTTPDEEPRRQRSSRLPTVEQVAREELQRSDGDVQQAIATMVDRINGDSRLYHLLMDPLVQAACYEIVSRVRRNQRSAIWNTPQPSTEETRRGVRALAAGTRTSLFSFPLPGGQRLGDATRDEVESAASFYINQANDMSVKGRWLT